MALTLASLHRYPVKSCRGEALERAVVEPWGLAGDRRWMLVDPDGTFVTARTAPTLLAVRADLTGAGLRLAAPGRADLHVDTPHPGGEGPGRLLDVRIWSSTLRLPTAGPDADAWFTDVVGRPVRLVHLDDPAARPTDPAFTGPDDRVSLADGYPLLVTTTASLAALDAAVAAAAPAGERPESPPMHRFRPNLVVDGAEPWEEDAWRRVRVGGVELRVVKACGRCVMTTFEPDLESGDVAQGREPLRTLARTRRVGKGLLFGVNVVPVLGPGAGEWSPVLDVGAEVEVLDAAPAGTRPLGH